MKIDKNRCTDLQEIIIVKKDRQTPQALSPIFYSFSNKCVERHVSNPLRWDWWDWWWCYVEQAVGCAIVWGGLARLRAGGADLGTNPDRKLLPAIVNES